MLQLSLQGGIKSRSMGVKLIVVCGLALLMTIPAFFVGGLVDDRTKMAADVIREISNHVGGQQTFLGPTLAIPYTIPPQSATAVPIRGIYLISPAKASAVVKIRSEEHTSELQSQSNLVCRLLLEKKKLHDLSYLY